MFSFFHQTSNNEVLNEAEILLKKKHDKIKIGQPEEQVCVVNAQVFGNFDKVPNEDPCLVTYFSILRTFYSSNVDSNC